MNLTILSRSPAIYTTGRLVDAARARGHRVRVVDPLHVALGLGRGKPALFHHRRRFPTTDAVIPRIGLSVHAHGMAVLSQLQLLGTPVVNGWQAIAASRNKLQCLQLLTSRGLGVPLTVMASDAAALKEMVRHAGGLPVLVKLLTRCDHSGLLICETLQSLEAALEALFGLGQDVVVQQYVRSAGGRDLRALVVGGQVVAGLRRTPRVGRFSRSLARGARFEACELSPACARAAESAARVVGLEVAAVDMLEVKRGPLVFEVTSSPGLRAAEEACGVDVATAVIARAEAMVLGRARRGEVDHHGSPGQQGT